MIKRFSSGDITTRPFGTFKHWSIQSMDSGALDSYGYSTYYNGRIEINEGVNLHTSSFYPSSSAHYVAANEPVNASGKYARNVYSVTNAMFYKYSDDPLKIFGVQESTQDLVTGDREIRELNDRVVVATLKHNVYGDSIAPETILLTDYSNIHEAYTIYDDGYTNLLLSGSHFASTNQINAIRDFMPTPYWLTSSGDFYVTFGSGNVVKVSYENSRYYAAMGLPVEFVSNSSGSEWAYDTSTSRDYFQPDNEHFGESVSSWFKYAAVGSSMDDYNLSDSRVGYVGLYKYDDNTSQHRLLKELHFPFTQSAYDTSSYFKDSFGYSVAVRDDALAVGSPYGEACNTGSYPGFVCMYDKSKGGIDYWGRVNLLRGDTDGDRFGNSVSIDNDILAVGAPYVSGSEGWVYIFRKKQYMNSGSCNSIPTGSTWQEVITAIDFCAELETSSYVASQSYTPTFVSGNFSWELETKLSSSIAAAGDNFGWCLEVSDNRLIVGTNKIGLGYATLFSCSYSSSLGECPTASWAEIKTFRADSTYADLDRTSGVYMVDVSSTITSNLFGTSVGISGDKLVIGCRADRAFIPYDTYTGDADVLGAAYFYHMDALNGCGLYKTFGKQGYSENNNFAYKVAIDGNTAAVSSLPDTLVRTVDFISGSYVLESSSYESTAPEDGVLGRVTMYEDSTGTGSWAFAGDFKRNKESGMPYYIYGYDISVCSDFLVVGAPLVNTASFANRADIIDAGNLTASMATSYSGSAFIYDLSEYQADQHLGNAFYKNGYLTITNTSSNYYDILTGTGSRGFMLDYQGSHAIYEHEYLVSIRPGEFNYSTNPTSLAPSNLAFDVNQDGIFDYLDVDLIMRYLQRKQFYEDFVFDDNGIIIEQSTTQDYSWWGQDLIITENEDVILKEGDSDYLVSSSFNVFTQEAFDYIESELVATGLLDVDGDGKINLNDGSILALYYFSTLNPTTLVPYLSSSSTRTYAAEITTYLDQYCYQNVSLTNPEFFGYQQSSSYDPTGSFLAPFVTTIGLYENNELVAVGKLGRPIKNLVDWPLNFVVRFDT